MKEKIALVTGAGSGFGQAIALRLATEGMKVIVAGRRKDRLEELAMQIQKLGASCLVLPVDVRDMEAVDHAVSSLPESWKHIEVLVNNAGLAVGKESIEEAVPDDWSRMIDTNIRGLLYVTRAVVPGMLDRGHGTIINIGSIAGKEVYPGGNVYSATKFAVDALTRSFRLDWSGRGIRVGQIAPGAAETEFSLVRFKGDERKAGAVYDGFVPLSANDIADAAWFIISRPSHVTIQDIVIMPTAQASATVIHRTKK